MGESQQLRFLVQADFANNRLALYLDGKHVPLEDGYFGVDIAYEPALNRFEASHPAVMTLQWAYTARSPLKLDFNADGEIVCRFRRRLVNTTSVELRREKDIPRATLKAPVQVIRRFGGSVVVPVVPFQPDDSSDPSGDRPVLTATGAEMQKSVFPGFTLAHRGSAPIHPGPEDEQIPREEVRVLDLTQDIQGFTYDNLRHIGPLAIVGGGVLFHSRGGEEDLFYPVPNFPHPMPKDIF